MSAESTNVILRNDRWTLIADGDSVSDFLGQLNGLGRIKVQLAESLPDADNNFGIVVESFKDTFQFTLLTGQKLYAKIETGKDLSVLTLSGAE